MLALHIKSPETKNRHPSEETIRNRTGWKAIRCKSDNRDQGVTNRWVTFTVGKHEPEGRLMSCVDGARQCFKSSTTGSDYTA